MINIDSSVLSNLSYEEFFYQATGNFPYPYQKSFQQRQLSSVTTLSAPTGAGKTEAFTVDWLYGRVKDLEETPRKLVITSPLKTLVEQTYERVKSIVENLHLDDRVSVYLLMGGKIKNEWDLDVSKEIIIIGTQDQILSRQLNRGYCLSWTRWPIHFAALNNDCRIVVDETQLQGVGYKTALYLQLYRDNIGCYGTSQLILCSATLDEGIIEQISQQITPVYCSVGENDFNDSYLGKKLTKPKLLSQAKTVWQGESNQEFINSLKKEILKNHVSDSLTLVVLNRVESVQKLSQSLQDSSYSLKLLHSRFRKGDRIKIVENLIDFTGIIIATQCVEAGIDLDARVLFTELCPWSSFVQRCGRAGRKGLEEEIKVFWIDSVSDNPGHAKPYELEELAQSRSLIEQLADASIQNLLAQPLPMQRINQDNLPSEVLEILFHTQLGDIDRDFGKYIREGTNGNVYLAWRNFTGTPNSDWQIQEIEVCSVPIDKVKNFSAIGLGWRYDPKKRLWCSVNASQINVGNTILLPSSAGGYSEKLGFTGNRIDIPTEIEITSKENNRPDYSSYTSCEVSLKQHSLDAAREMGEIADRLEKVLLPGMKDFLVEVAQWHDLGKAHQVFQETIGGNRENLLAKSSQIGGKSHSRKGFRHEFASALAALEQDKDFVFAYLVCCHHGKVRTKILKSSFSKRLNNFSKLEYYGVRENDLLPIIDLGHPINHIDSMTLTFRKDNNNSLFSKWWENQCWKLIDEYEYGIFRLAYLETLVRCADAVASSKYK